MDGPRRAAALLAVPALVLTMAAARPHSRSVPLPDDFQPEGIATGHGPAFYVGSMNDGDIYRGSLRTGHGRVFVDTSGRQALGMKVDAARHRLFVAGGATGHAYVYDTRTGRTLADLTLTRAKSTLVNDVVVTRHAAYFTETLKPRIYRVPIARDGALGRPRTLRVTGPARVIPENGLGLNGIAAARGGRTLLVDHTALGKLFTLDPRTGATRPVRLGKKALVPGAVDGILRRGRTLWVVENSANLLAKVRLAPGLHRGRVTARVTDPRFRVPTAVARYGDHLALVNARFDLGLPPPFGPGAPPGTKFDVVVLPAP